MMHGQTKIKFNYTLLYSSANDISCFPYVTHYNLKLTLISNFEQKFFKLNAVLRDMPIQHSWGGGGGVES